MSGSEEETYSIMFSSLKHPARRKILRMLSERTLTFSEMLEELAIPSSHLTYHLENLGELVIKNENGKYKLSSFGKASVAMMKGAEEVPDVQGKRFSALPLRWKSLFGILLIGMVLLASMSLIQYSGLNQLSANYTNLQQNYEEVKTQNKQLLSWNSSVAEAMLVLKDVIQIDTSNYQTVSLISSTAEYRTDLGGVVEEVSKYSLVNEASSIELTLRFRNGHFSLFQLNQIEGLPNFPPVYTKPQPSDPIQAASAILQRYQTVSGDSYLKDMNTLLASANDTATEQTLGSTKLMISSDGSNAQISLQYTVNGSDFSTKSVNIMSQNHIITSLSDDYFLYNVGNAQVNVSQTQATQIARDATDSFSWNVNGTKVSDFIILLNQVTAEFIPHTRADNLTTLYPYWYVTLPLDKTYPGGVNIIAVGVWADTGKVANIEARSGSF
jgi:hypothetical protein